MTDDPEDNVITFIPRPNINLEPLPPILIAELEMEQGTTYADIPEGAGAFQMVINVDVAKGEFDIVTDINTPDMALTLLHNAIRYWLGVKDANQE